MSAALKQELLDTITALAASGLARATGGNFSVRIDAQSFFITRSGADKARLTPQDLVACDLHGVTRDAGITASAETLIHAALYASDPQVGAVLHTHSVAVTSLSVVAPGDIEFTGYEMQKSIRGQVSHEHVLRLPVLENSQDMKRVHDQVINLWPDLQPGYGLVLRGHGLYSWGENLFEARRHAEGFEYLAECELSRRLLTSQAGVRQAPPGSQ